jgi:hypothetical protein
MQHGAALWETLLWLYTDTLTHAQSDLRWLQLFQEWNIAYIKFLLLSVSWRRSDDNIKMDPIEIESEDMYETVTYLHSVSFLESHGEIPKYDVLWQLLRNLTIVYCGYSS